MRVEENTRDGTMMNVLFLMIVLLILAPGVHTALLRIVCVHIHTHTHLCVCVFWREVRGLLSVVCAQLAGRQVENTARATTPRRAGVVATQRSLWRLLHLRRGKSPRGRGMDASTPSGGAVKMQDHRTHERGCHGTCSCRAASTATSAGKAIAGR